MARTESSLTQFRKILYGTLICGLGRLASIFSLKTMDGPFYYQGNQVNFSRSIGFRVCEEPILLIMIFTICLPEIIKIHISPQLEYRK